MLGMVTRKGLKQDETVFFWIPGKRGATASVKLRDLQRIQTSLGKKKGAVLVLGFITI